MRKYELNPMSPMTLSSKARRSTAASGSGRPSARRRPQGEVLEVVGVVGEALGEREVGQLRLAELDLDVGPLGDPQRVVAGLGQLARTGRASRAAVFR